MQELLDEKEFYGNCCNTYDEEYKHFIYAQFMGLPINCYFINLHKSSRILDVGGGPVSMLLKTLNLKEGCVWDPTVYPKWTEYRYKAKNIKVVHDYGENLKEKGWDEVWLYNSLQYVEDPEKLINNCLNAAKIFRIFEWVDTPIHEGKPFTIRAEDLNRWIGNKGQVVTLDDPMCNGKAFFGSFSTGN